MTVYCLVKTGYRRTTQAFFHATSIVSENEKRIVFVDDNGTKTTVLKKDLITVKENKK